MDHLLAGFGLKGTPNKIKAPLVWKMTPIVIRLLSPFHQPPLPVFSIQMNWLFCFHHQIKKQRCLPVSTSKIENFLFVFIYCAVSWETFTIATSKIFDLANFTLIPLRWISELFQVKVSVQNITRIANAVQITIWL